MCMCYNSNVAHLHNTFSKERVMLMCKMEQETARNVQRNKCEKTALIVRNRKKKK